LLINADGTYTYTPSTELGSAGSDSFSVVVQDTATGDEVTANLSITVSEVEASGPEGAPAIADVSMMLAALEDEQGDLTFDDFDSSIVEEQAAEDEQASDAALPQGGADEQAQI